MEHTRDGDGYGGHLEWHTWYLRCSVCKRKSIELNNGDRDGHGGIDPTDYMDVTGRDLDLKELGFVFKENNHIFHQLKGINPDSIYMVMSDPKLELAISKKEALIWKHMKEFSALKDKYRKGQK